MYTRSILFRFQFKEKLYLTALILLSAYYNINTEKCVNLERSNKAGENMKRLESIEQLHRFIGQEGIVILEVASITCAPCVSIRRKIEEWQKEYPSIPAAYIEMESVPEAGGELQIFTAPAVLVYIDGKLSIKQAGYFSLDEVFHQIERYISMMGQ